MAEELLVSLNKRDPSCGLGFSLLGTPGFPPVIYDIAENSPAAESGKVEAGDVILKVNETDVKRYNTKEVLKCLRLSENPVVLKLKRDPNIKAKVRSYLSSPEFHRDLITENVAPGERKSSLSQQDRRDRDRELDDKFKNHVGSRDEDSPVPPPSQHPLPVNEVTRSQAIEDLENEPSAKNNHQQPRFEAFMMTGDRVLKLTRNQQVSLLPKHSRKIDSLLKHHHNNNNNYNHNYHSVPTSPIDTSDKSRNNHHHSKKSKHATDDDASSVTSSLTGTSPPSSIVTSTTGAAGHGHVTGGSSADAASSSYVVRTSKSEDHLQLNKNSNSLSTVSIDFDDDVTSSLNTLLCTRPDSEGEIDQRVWSYHTTDPTVKMKNSSSSVSNNSSENNGSSQNHSLSSPASPTSVSSSVMSSTSSSSSSAVERKKMHQQVQSSSGGGANNAGGAAGGGSNNQNISSSLVNNGGDLSQSEAISNISSPDFQEDSEILNSKDFNIEISDPSDSDSTLLVSESAKGGSCRLQRNETPHGETDDHRIVIQVKGRCSPKVNFRNNSRRGSHKEQDYSNSGEQPCYMTLNECDDEQLLALTKGAATLARAVSPPLPNSQSSNGLSEDESDVESLRSFHYSPKAVDHPSASRLAKRLFTLDGFKKSDVSRHLSKNNDFSRAVADEFLRYFTFEGDTLDVALRKFLKQFSLSGETQERERVLIHFSKRYLDCNPGTFKSQDAVHTLTCALMLLNSDLHGKIIGRKMTCSEFIENLAELNDGENFPKDILKSCYQAIKNFSLEWAVDDEAEDNGSMKGGVGLSNDNCQIIASDKGLFQSLSSTIEYKKGYVMRKCCMEPYGKKTPLGKRGWKMFYCTLRDFVLYLPKDEHGFRNLHNAIRIHHSLATKATDYRKKQHVFRLQTADQAEYLFQTSDSKELQSWVDTINFVCASFSAPPLPGGVGSQKKFQRPLLPTAYTKLNLREQMLSHDETLMRLEIELEKHRSHPPERGAKALIVQNYKEKDAYLHHELKRYRTYAWILRVKLSQYPELDQPSSLTESCIGEVGELEEEYCDDSVMTASSGKNSPSLNRYSYRAAIYSSRDPSDVE